MLCYCVAFVCLVFGMMIVALPLVALGMALEKKG